MAAATTSLVGVSAASVNAQIPSPGSKQAPAQHIDASDAEPTPPTPAPVVRQPTRDHVVQLLPDIDLDGGVGYAFAPERVVGFGRLRLGLLTWMEPANPLNSPLLISVGATYGLSSFSYAELGVETELLHLKTGFWFQGAGAVDLVNPGPVWRLAAGWSVFGVEAQRRTFPRDVQLPGDAAETFVVGGKLRAPIGPLLKLLLP